MVEGSVTKAEMLKSFEDVLKLVREVKDSNSKEWALIKSAISMLGEKLQEANTSDLTTTKQELVASVSKALKEQEDGMKFIYDKAASLKSIEGPRGLQGLPGLKGDSIKGDPGLNGSPDTPEQIREKITEIKIPIDAVENLQEELKRVARGQQVGGGGRQQLLVSSVKKGVANYLNLVAGSNVTLTHTLKNGVQTVTFASTGGSGFSEITMTGTIDGNNVTFTAASAPTYIVADGVWTKLNKGWTNVGLTITMFIPPSSSIFGV